LAFGGLDQRQDCGFWLG
jgi:hypothetical protein